MDKFISRLIKIASCLVLIFLLLCGFASCSSDSDGYIKVPEKSENHEPYAPYYADSIILELREKSGMDNLFAIELFKTTYRQSEDVNVFVSPLSMNMAFSMVLNGAKGNTLEEIKTVLKSKNYSLDDINKYNKSLREAFKAVDTLTTLSMVNSIWCHNTLTVQNGFLSASKGAYDAEVKALDFNSPDAVSQINDWVSEQTNNKIPWIIKEVSPENKLFIINTLYLRSGWADKFDKNKTSKEDFYSEESVSMGKVNMMIQNTYCVYSDDENCRYLNMRYGNWAFSMILMLPHEGKTVDDVILNLDIKSWNTAMEKGTLECIRLHLPRFKAECSYDMHEFILPKMGMELPFSEKADFTGLIKEQPLKISRIIHKAYINIDEEGTEAAASSIVEVLDGGPMVFHDYIVNKPFAFAIRENSTGIILFMGKIGSVN